MKEELHTGFMRHALSQPDAPALKLMSSTNKIQTVSYAQLWWQTCTLSTTLQNRIRLKPGELVGVYCKSSFEAIVAIIGTILTEGAYVPFNTTHPHPRNIGIFRQLKGRIRAVVVQQSLEGIRNCVAADESVLDDVSLIVLDNHGKIIEIHHPISQNIVRPDELTTISSNLCYIAFSTGTTGEPKLIEATHDGVKPNVRELSQMWMLKGPSLGVPNGDVIMLSSPLSFDPSVVDIFVTLNSGACLFIVPSRYKRVPAVLCKGMREAKVTVIQCTPSLFMRFNQYQRNLLLSGLKVLALGGERFPSLGLIHPYLQSNPSQFPNLSIYNLYGTTEVSVWGFINTVFQNGQITNCMENGVVTLGRAMEQTTFLLKSLETNEVIQSGVGELWLGRSCGDKIIIPTKPTGDIVQISEKGAITYEGRRDKQIKVNGIRCNLDYIERMLLQISGISQCHIIYCELFGVLKAFVVPQLPLGRKVITKRIIEYCKTTLPAAMIPIIYVVSSLPLNINSKIDNHALCSITMSPCSEPFSRTPTKEDIWTVISDYFEIYMQQSSKREEGESPPKKRKKEDPVRSVSFFVELGGSSIDVVRLVDFTSSHFALSRDATIQKELTETLLHKPLEEFIKVLFHILSNPANLVCLQASSVFKQLSSTILSTDIVDYGIVSEWKSWRLTGFPCTTQLPAIMPRKPDELAMHVKWKAHLGRCLDSSPLIVTRKIAPLEFSQTVYIGSHSHIFAAISLETGLTMWSVELGDRVDSSAILSLNGKYILVGCYDTFLYVIDALLGTIKWKFRTGGEIRCSPCLDTKTGYVWIGSYDGTLYCVDLQNEICLRQFALGGYILSSPVIDSTRNILSVGCHNQELYIISNLSSKPVITAQFKTEAPIFSSPCYDPGSGNIIFGSCDKNLYCVSPDGQKIWSRTLGGPIFSSPIVLYSKVYQEPIIAVGCHDGMVYMVSLQNKLLATIPLPGGVYSSVTGFLLSLTPSTTQKTTKEILCACSMTGTISLIDLATSQIISKLNVSGGIFQSSPVVSHIYSDPKKEDCTPPNNICILVGCRDDHLYCIDVY